MVIGTLAVDGWAVTFGTVRRDLGGASCSHAQFLLAVRNVTAHPSTTGVGYQLHIIRCGTTITFAL